jgi:threonine dehydratase
MALDSTDPGRSDFTPVSFEDIVAAQKRIAPYVHCTPVLTSRHMDERSGAAVYFKCENFQKLGAFKARGAHNAVFSLESAEAHAGVVTHSSGNHGAALALAAKNRGVSAHVIMPKGVSAPKLAAVQRLGARVILCEPNLAAREAAAAHVRRDTGAILVHPYNDARVIAGQGTAALELLDQVPDLDAILVPVGGGGLLGGTAIAAKGRRSDIRIFAAEPAGADDAYRSFKSGALTGARDPHTMADGLRASLGPIPFSIIRACVEDIATVSEESIVAAMRLVWEVLKIVIEPSSAVPMAALLDGRLNVAGKRVGVILTGGNVDLDRLPWIQP